MSSRGVYLTALRGIRMREASQPISLSNTSFTLTFLGGFTQIEKIPVSKISTLKKATESSVSPSTSIVSLEDEVIALRARNKAMAKALRVIKETATKEKKRHHDLVWYARNRTRFPNSDARKRIEADMGHSEELQKLSAPEADYFHGIHSGILAAARVFEKQADILHINEKDDATEVMSEAAKHEKKIEESLQNYPHVHAEVNPDQV